MWAAIHDLPRPCEKKRRKDIGRWRGMLHQGVRYQSGAVIDCRHEFKSASCSSFSRKRRSVAQSCRPCAALCAQEVARECARTVRLTNSHTANSHLSFRGESLCCCRCATAFETGWRLLAAVGAPSGQCRASPLHNSVLHLCAGRAPVRHAFRPSRIVTERICVIVQCAQRASCA